MFFIAFISVNLFIGLFLGINAWAAFSQLIHNKLIFWLIVSSVTQIYWISRLSAYRFAVEIPALLYFLAASLFAFCIMALFIVTGADIILLFTRIIKPLNFVYQFIKTHSVQTGILVTALVLCCYFAGLFIANFPVETHYKISVNKPLGAENVKIIMVSDLHITTFTRTGAINSLVERINKLDADIVLLGGDIIDGGMRPFVEKDLSGFFSRLKSRYGVYMVMGNHEYYGGDTDSVVKGVMSAGIRVLRDEKLFLEPLGITLIGRDDISSAIFKGHPRAALKELMSGADLSKPIIVLDHQPQKKPVREALTNGVDLQLSGHTHSGQFFPFNLVVKKMYINSWKLWCEGSFNLIVSCGFGTWGPPIRTASYSEIVVIELVI
ncbi:MAG: metallophosphoesterase [Deferribacteraceae bacterium]|jgi:predicted MPP superfamily phosphohydrolase|nr:metallophosphoesterase [Deferribacteraceae bacterium]